MKPTSWNIVAIALLLTTGMASAKTTSLQLKDGSAVKVETRKMHGRMMVIVPAEFFQKYMSMSEGHDVQLGY